MKDQLTLVTCVESGTLEPMCVRMVESLRRFGGRLSDCPVIAVTPRFGPGLSRQTLRQFEALGVRYVRRYARRRTWYHYINKPNSLIFAEEIAQTPLTGWLDADTLIVGEPAELLLPPELDFTAAAPDIDLIGSAGAGDPNNAYWRAVCGVLKVDVEAMPFLTSHVERRRIRLYWQAGIFVYWRETGFAQQYLADCLKLLDARISVQSGVHWLEQMALGLTMLRMGLRWREMSVSHNHAIVSTSEKHFDPGQFAAARIVHYHDMMEPGHWPKFCGYMRAGHPAVAEWLEPQGPVSDPSRGPTRATSKALRALRSFRRRMHHKRSVAILPGDA